ncbi:MAG: hypothetical protein ACD_71C00114G0013 [uncultured bacterium (gcode 4)]|uniref:Uncharacterized protein n=1 Tax=uncultured bacterium (gcode 4) TaxID=1234023 RepID=K1YNG3_9BACT|nr:MAG: hypothetical protein ACD_71C00114G0013 [uncultured bacterium (gcode 4)]
METLSKFHYDYVSKHINQTMLINDLLKNNFLDYSDLQWAYDSETDEYINIYQFVLFSNFYGSDFEKLIEAKIPVLDTEYGTWVWITSYGSHYDLYVYPQLINALFDTDIRYEDIEKLK